MSRKVFCDVCGKEITASVTAYRVKDHVVLRHNANIVTVNVEILCGLGATMNSGDLCKSCLFCALDHLDPRPKAGASCATEHGHQAVLPKKPSAENPAGGAA